MRTQGLGSGSRHPEGLGLPAAEAGAARRNGPPTGARPAGAERPRPARRGRTSRQAVNREYLEAIN